MTDSSTKRALITRAFNDAGTGQRYHKGDKPLLDAAVLENYMAAGLATEAPTPAPAATGKAKAKRAAEAAAQADDAADPENSALISG